MRTSSKIIVIALASLCVMSGVVGDDAPKVNFQIYGDSNSFLYINSLGASIQSSDFWQIANLSFYPSSKRDGEFYCDNSDLICQSNKYIACGAKLFDQTKAALFVSCYSAAMSYAIESRQGSNSLQFLQLCEESRAYNFSQKDIEDIHSCFESDLANQLIQDNIQATKALNPEKIYSPWIVVNGVHTNQLNDDASLSLIKVACQQYTQADQIEVCKAFLPSLSNHASSE